jgi:putative transposase
VKLRTYKFRIYPSESQKELLAKTFGCTRFIYNKMLAMKMEAYKTEKKSISIFALDKQISLLKQSEETKWLGEVNSQALQSSLRNLDSAFTKFFRDKKGFPKFKNKYGNQSFSNPQNTKVDFDTNKLIIPKFSEGIKTIFHRKFKGKIKTSTISKTKTGKYFVSINVECEGDEIAATEPKIETCVGIDLGIKTYATLSNGDKIVNPKFLIKKIRRLSRLSRQHSKKKKGSKNREKSRHKLARQHERVTDSRKDFIHQTTSKLVKNQDYQSFAIEDLSVMNMVKNRKLSRAINDCAWRTFRTILTYKAQRAGKEVLVIGRFEPSSKLCSCGTINQNLTLKDRDWTCNSCGTIHDRDILAANNIRDFAFCKQDTRKESVRLEQSKPLRKKKTLLEIPI